jgi:hypothetical protein
VATGAFGASALERAGSVRALTSADGGRNLPQYDNCQPVAVYKYLLSISAKKAGERSMKSASCNLISSPTRYFNTDLTGSNLIVLPAHITLLLFIIELHNILTSFSGLPSFFSLKQSRNSNSHKHAHSTAAGRNQNGKNIRADVAIVAE